ncbi:MAG: hypothetical protein CME06_12820 [Gemmatimonadetes bacterium]|nr:hypothetical protein [Gemmatimonadota bacterium]
MRITAFSATAALALGAHPPASIPATPEFDPVSTPSALWRMDGSVAPGWGRGVRLARWSTGRTWGSRPGEGIAFFAASRQGS